MARPAFWVVTLVISAAATGTLGAQGVKPKPNDTDWVAPATERTRVSPVSPSPQGLERGKNLYVKHCATCHGDKGKGDGPSARLHAQRTSRPPYDLTLPEVQIVLADGEIFWKITVGYKRGGKVIMPAYGVQVPSEEDRWRIVQYVRTLGPTH
jgi:mono/diheme cytochrome c family protein